MSQFKATTVQTGTHITDEKQTTIIEVPIDLVERNVNCGLVIAKLDKKYFSKEQITLLEKRLPNLVKMAIKDL